MASASISLPRGKKYHCYFVYNYPSRRDRKTADTELSLKFVEFLVEELKSWGYTECYYYEKNAKLGEDVFNQSLDPASSSILTLVIITEHFTTNGWIHYVQKTVLKTKLDEGNQSELIPIVLGDADVPKELVANIAVWFGVDKNTWQDHEQELWRLKMTLDGKVSVTITERDTPSQDPGDGILRSELGHMIVNPQPSMQGTSSITHDMRERQMESLSSSVAAVHVSRTLPLLPGSQATSSQASQDHDTSSSSSRTDKEADTEKRYVMISYNWAQQEKALWIKEQLEMNRYPIWIDVNNMGPKLLTSMAEGVEGAFVVLLCISKNYRESNNCQREALYALQRKKIMIPLKLEDFEPDGWLGISTVDYLFYDFSEKKSREAKMEELLKVLAKHYNRVSKQPQITPSTSFVVPQEETESDQDPGANQSTGSE